jgi:hypothetical protein
VSLNAKCAAALLPHFQSRSLECGPLADATLPVPGLGLQIVASDARAGSNNAVFVTFDAQPLGSSKSESGICMLAAGMGGTEESACVDAAKQWALGVLPVLVSYMLRSHVCEVEKMPLVVGVQDSNERYGWTVHLGPVIGRSYGVANAQFDETQLGDLTRSAAFNPIFHVVHPYATHTRLMWIESFAARYFLNRKVDATCRLNNKDFQEGRESLLSWAEEWPDTGVPFLTKRQFVLFESTPAEQLKSSTNLVQTLENEMQKKRTSN